MLFSYPERVHYDSQPVYMRNLIIIRFLEWSDYLSGRVKSMMWFYPIYHNQMAYMIMENPIKTHKISPQHSDVFVQPLNLMHSVRLYLHI